MNWNQGAMQALELAKEAMPGRVTRRQNLQYRRQQLKIDLDVVEKAIAALDAHPELEEFIETLAKAGA